MGSVSENETPSHFDLLEWLSFDQCAEYLSQRWDQSVTVDVVKQLCAIGRFRKFPTPKMLLIDQPCISFARAWRLFNWYGGGADDPTRDDKKRQSQEGHHAWVRFDDRVIYVTGAFGFSCGYGASEHARWRTWLLSPIQSSVPHTFSFHKDLRVIVGVTEMLPMIQNEEIQQISGAEMPSSQHADNYSPRLGDYTRDCFVFSKGEIDEWLTTLPDRAKVEADTSLSAASRRRTLTNQEVLDLAEKFKREGYADFTKRAAKQAGISTARVRQIRADSNYAARQNSWSRN